MIRFLPAVVFLVLFIVLARGNIRNHHEYDQWIKESDQHYTQVLGLCKSDNPRDKIVYRETVYQGINNCEICMESVCNYGEKAKFNKTGLLRTGDLVCGVSFILFLGASALGGLAYYDRYY